MQEIRKFSGEGPSPLTTRDGNSLSRPHPLGAFFASIFEEIPHQQGFQRMAQADKTFIMCN